MNTMRFSVVVAAAADVGAAGIEGASEDRELAKKCIAPEDLGEIVRGILEQPDRLAVPELTVQPTVQDIVPM